MPTLELPPLLSDVDRTPVVHVTVEEDELPRAGDRIDDAYRIVRPLGSGTMGTVFEAFDLRLEREVALKLIHRSQLDGTGVTERFLREAQAMARVSHPNVVMIHAYSTHRGRPYFAMELVDGPNLAEWNARRERFDLDEVLDVLDQLAAGIAAIHAAGAIHRDIKPANVLVGPGPRVAVTDLGLAALRGMPDRFATGELAGTPAYLAPEAAQGNVPAALASRADVYSLGVVAFELLTGRRPFDARGVPAMLQMHAHEAPPRPRSLRPDLPEALEAPLLDALVKDPAARTPTADEFRAALGRARRQITRFGSDLRVLLADDDPSSLRAMADVLGEELPGSKVVTVPNGGAALEAAVRFRPDVVVSDLQMPGRNGLELTAALRANPVTRRVPIIIVTGYGGAQHWQRLRELGATRFLVKPLDLDMLVHAVRTVTRHVGADR